MKKKKKSLAMDMNLRMDLIPPDGEEGKLPMLPEGEMMKKKMRKKNG